MTSNWVCPAFYVEKRSERLRGKKRLVVDYKPLNHFLKDDKFPLPKTSTLPILLKESKIFSKFDLKFGFWQLGVDPSERHKTAFCIPNAQYQWTVLPFGLKVAPSLFQKAITKILEPLLDNAIIYIDDILLFSKDMESHKKLLSQFLERENLYGIMFSEKKIQLAQQEIYFLGMKFSQGTYQPQPHIAEELLNFPEENLSVKQIQQFLGIINYIRDFIPKIARYTSPLSKMLKKYPPPWGSEQTKAVQEIKKIAQNPPALKILGDGKRILQTDASDHYWGAVFIEEVQGRKFYCGHASGQFKEAEKHYHTTYKEALAVKNGIKKFDFHLRGYHFEVQMDNSSFPKILDFKSKLPPEPQILRLKDWFSRYDFTVKHIKGKHNLIPDFLSRPQNQS
uniref:Polyprotein n=1 Tax=Cajanus cajan TaxID=3821 RepID=A0A151U9N2_CAJCA|nr:polyprotein [Cajanus cajan]